jgi:hypothetical protein
MEVSVGFSFLIQKTFLRRLLKRLAGVDSFNDPCIVVEKLEPAVSVCFIPRYDEVGHILRLYRFSQKREPALGNKLVPLYYVAPFACTYLVLPRIWILRPMSGIHRFPPGKRYDVIDGEFVHPVPFSAVLTPHIVSVDDVQPRVDDSFLGDLMEVEEHDDSREREGKVL